MGKAIIIDGLIIDKPLGVVTFNTDVYTLSLDKTSISGNCGDEVTLQAIATSSEGTSVDVTFETSNPNVAVINSVASNKATISLVGDGYATITAKTGELSKTCAITSAMTGDALLKDYYAVNTSINATEKSALNTLVLGIYNAGLWNKFAYFYPMLGDNITDATLDAISPSTEDIISGASLDGLAVNNRVIESTRTSSGVGTITRASALEPANISCIMCGSLGMATNAVGVNLQSSGSNKTQFNLAAPSGAKFPCMYSGTTQVPTAKVDGIDIADANRIIMGTQLNGVASVYYHNTLYASADVAPTHAFTRTNGVLLGATTAMKYTLMTIGVGLTADDWAVIYPLVSAYITAIGKTA